MSAAHNKHTDMRTAARRVRGLGPARSGTTDFWHQRLTAFASIFLSIAFIVIVISLLGRSHAAAVQILGSPFVAIVMLLFILTGVYHMWIGMQEILIDYIHADQYKFPVLMLNTFFCVAVGLASAFAILKLSFGV